MKRNHLTVLLFVALAAIIIFSLKSRGQYVYKTTQPIFAAWEYPTNAVTPDLAFIIYTNSVAPSPGNPVSSWMIWQIVMATNTYTLQGTNFPYVSGTNEFFSIAISPPPVPTFYAIASSNVTGLGSAIPTNGNPEIISLSAPLGFGFGNFP